MKMTKKQKTKLLEILLDYGHAAWDSPKKEWTHVNKGTDGDGFKWYVGYYVSAGGVTIFDISGDDYRTVKKEYSVNELLISLKDLKP